MRPSSILKSVSWRLDEIHVSAAAASRIAGQLTSHATANVPVNPALAGEWARELLIIRQAAADLHGQAVQLTPDDYDAIREVDPSIAAAVPIIATEPWGPSVEQAAAHLCIQLSGRSIQPRPERSLARLSSRAARRARRLRRAARSVAAAGS
nr:MAG TPA: hypothetical protein [Caudoviricetes sp.]